ncbi:DUF4253 domain-containing protein [bacterium]|nr:DUF4253 domain-containing protein [bacterium]
MGTHYQGHVGPLLPSRVNPKLDCIILPDRQAWNLLAPTRKRLPPGWTAFLGAYFEDNYWWPERKIVAYRELVIAPGEDQFACLCLAGMESSCEARLREWDQRFGLEILCCEATSLSFQLLNRPGDPAKFVAELYSFCPDPVDSGWVQSLDNWLKMVTEHGLITLHW